MGKNTTTDNIELTKMARLLLGRKYHGTYSSDRPPALTVREPYAIINTKPSHTGGEHWVALARVPRTGKLMHYDSFGRSHAQLFPGIFPGAIDTELDAEQENEATDCGQRSLAFLVIFDRYGSKAAKLV